MSTIAAISTPVGAGGIGIIRVSGEDALRIADAIFVCKGKGGTAEKLSANPLKLCFGDFVAEDFRDRGYAVYFPADKAYTGETTVEFYLHGGVRVMRGALDEIIKRGAQPAGKGEFTKRAFLSGKMSLADAEGVADMINAESAAGLRAAYRLMDGSVSRRINAIADALLDVITGLEAVLDYPDETEDEILPPLEAELEAVLADINGLLATARQGRIAKHGITAVLVGAPNAGKSSLMNALLGEDRAIVTDIAGTTRDTLEGSFECDGVRVNLIDTAGLRESDDVVESEGIERAVKAAKGADVVMRVVDTTAPTPDFSAYDFEGVRQFTVRTKCDLTSYACPRMYGCFAVSAKDNVGIDGLRRALAALYAEGTVEGGEIITSERHVSALYRAKNAIESAIVSVGGTVDCTLIDLREAYDALSEITGRTATEAVVDNIFSKFCVGK